MPGDDDALKAAFAELHRCQREQAPSFAPMEERALRQAALADSPPRRSAALPRLAWSGVMCAAALLIGWGTIHFRDRGRGITAEASAGTEPVGQLVAALETQLDVGDANSEVTFPTDLLLAGHAGEASE